MERGWLCDTGQRRVGSSHSRCLSLKPTYWDGGNLTAGSVFGKCCCLTFVLILVQLVCYLKKKILHSVSGFCYLRSREQISDNPPSAFVQFPSSLHIRHALWVVNLASGEMGLVRPDPAVGQRPFRGPFLGQGSGTGCGAAAGGWACNSLRETQPEQRTTRSLCVTCLGQLSPLRGISALVSISVSDSWWVVRCGRCLSGVCSRGRKWRNWSEGWACFAWTVVRCFFPGQHTGNVPGGRVRA